MRLFVAVTPPTNALDHLAEAVEHVRSTPGVQPVSDPAGLRWVRPASWHLTLAFLGAVEPTRVDGLETRLGRAAARQGPFELSITGAGRFGDRVFWAGITGDRRALVRLAASVGAAARRCGIAVEERPYRPHLTLARGVPDVSTRPAVSALAAYGGPSWTADSVHLIESRLGEGAGRTAEHIVVRSWPLGAAGGRQ